MIKGLSPSTTISLVALFVALGGAGIAATGGNFILGQANVAETPTRLRAQLAQGSLRIENPSPAANATALHLIVDEDNPPMTVTSSTRVVNLNADRLDERHANQLMRVARGFTQNFFSIVSFSDRAAVTLEIPKPGFVLVNGQAFGDTDAATCTPCFMHLQVRDETTLDSSPAIIVSVRNGDSHAGAVTFVFPVTAGSRTFSLEAGIFPGTAEDDVDVRNPALTALYVPFGPTGNLTLAAQSASSSGATRLGPIERDGTRRVQE